MGSAAIFLLAYTRGSISALVVMYSINVFLTFSLSQLGMSGFFLRRRTEDRHWKKHLSVHVVGLVLCVTILCITIYEKFTEGAWVTLFITSGAITVCYLIRRHYRTVAASIRQLDELLMDIPTNQPTNTQPLVATDPTAVILVGGFNALGLHTLLSIVRYFPNMYRNFIFVTVSEVDSGAFKGAAEVEALTRATIEGLEKYVKVTRRHGFPADYRRMWRPMSLMPRSTSANPSFESTRDPQCSRANWFSPRHRHRQALAQSDGIRHPAPPALGGSAGHHHAHTCSAIEKGKEG